MIGTLPRSLEVNGKFYRIRSDFRDVLKIVIAFGDPDLEDKEKAYICLFILFKDFDAIPKDDYEAAFKAALAFIDHNDKPEDTGGKPPPRVMDWEQDESIMFPAVNKVAGF
ncbi:MAG: Gp15 family bacteriophage protein [Oscillospiraceae bacterium]